MDNTILAVLAAIVSSLVLVVISVIVTYFTTRSQTRLNVIAEFDKELGANRLKAYQALWKLTEPLARYSRDPVTYQVINDLTMKMRAWYFHEGGIFLTPTSRDRYFDLKASTESLVKGFKTDQNVMQANNEYFASLKQKSMANPNEEIDDEKGYVKFIIGQGSGLRTALATNVGTRNISFVSNAKVQKPRNA